MNHKVIFHTLILLSGFFSCHVSAQTIKTVGASGADYATLKLAFDAVNAGTLTGAIELQVIDNTTEPIAGAILYGSKSLNTTIAKVSGGSGYTNPVLSFGGGGTGASGTFTVFPSTTVTSLTLTSAGNGYTTVPTVIFSGTSSTAATASVTLTPTSVATVKKSSGGAGYTSAPTVTFTGGGGGADLAVTAVLGTSVISCAVTNMGSGYTSTPTVTITGTGGSGATATAVVTANKVTGITITNPGSGYPAATTVTISGGGGSGATATANTSGGTAGTVESYIITNPGSGYTSIPTAVLTGGGFTTAATATITLTPTSIGSINLLTAGVGYTTIPTVSFSNTNPIQNANATVSLTVAPTTINVVTLTTRGTGYNSPSVVFTDPTGKDANYTTTVSAVNYSSLKIYPTATGKTIGGTGGTAAMIQLNGTKNVTIDGSLNASGSGRDLTINYTSATTNQANTINFAQNSDGNTIQYCYLTGNSTTATKGIVSFDLGYAGNSYGNGNNTIANNTFTGNAGGKPMYCIYSSGSLVYPNIGNQILDNDFKDFLNPGLASSGIYLFGTSKTASSSTGWTITGNSFYQTTPLIPTASVAYSAIQIGTGGNYYVAGSGHTISNNYIGGSAPHCVGLWEKTNAFDNPFSAINLILDPIETVSAVDNNTIQKFAWANSGLAVWKGIEVFQGNANIGSIAGNTIGDNTTTGSITVTDGAATGNYNGLVGISISPVSSGTVNVENNKIGSLTAANALSTANNSLYGIYVGINGKSNVTVNNNTIGGVANSMNCSSPSTVSLQELSGIYCKGTILHTINNNTIANLTNSSTNSGASKGMCVGINLTHGIVTNNIVHDLTCLNNCTDGQYGVASVVGITSNFNGAGKPVTVSGNTVYNLSNSNTGFTGYVTGISFVGGSTPPVAVNTCNGNFVYGLSTNASATGAHISGILSATGLSTISNNIISLGDNSTVQVSGITEGQANVLGNDSYIYHNTVYIGGTPTSGSAPSYAFYSASTANTRALKNNIFANTRTGGTGTHYGMTANATNLTRDYNDYIGTVLPAKDANSLTIDPKFLNASGTSALNYTTDYTVSLGGTSGTGVTTDYATATRNGSNPKMGAYETSSDIVVVNGTPLTIDQNVNVANLTINPGANLTLNAGKTLNVTTFSINSDETNGTGTFVDKGTTNIAKANVQQYLTGSLGTTFPNGRFWYLSSPVTGATSNTFNALADANKLWDYTESTHGYTEITDNTSDLIIGKGYAARLGATATITLTGTGLKTGAHTFDLTRNDGDVKSGYNLIGNPYPSYLDWQVVTLPATVLPTIWTRSCSAGGAMGFDTYNSSLQEGARGVSSIGHTNVTGYIAPLQAFWVRVASGNAAGSFTVNNDMRSISDQATPTNKLKAPAFLAHQVLRLQVSNESNSDETVIAFNGNASNDFDYYDSPKMTNDNVSIPEIYTLAGAEKVAINGMNNFNIDEQLSLGFTTGSSNTFTIKATDIRNFDIDTKIVLKDNLMNSESDLTQGAAYSFTSDVISTTSRFSIVFKSASGTTGLTENTMDNPTMNIFKNANGQITIVRNDANGKQGLFTVCNSVGQKLMSGQTSGTVTVINKTFCSGVYLLTLNVAGDVTTKKVIIN